MRKYLLFVLPLLAISAYFIELRIEARFIQRTPVDLDLSQLSLSGLDQAVAAHADYLWRNEEMRLQFVRPPRQVQVKRFYMDKYEVNQKQYRQFISWYGLHNDEALHYLHDRQPQDYEFSNPYAQHKILGRLDVPAAGIGFFEAYAYCRASRGSLPSTEQWSAAAGGKEARSYPWGEEFVGTAWRYNDPVLNIAAAPVKRSVHATPEQVFDLGNGLSEWTLSFVDDGRALLRGGNSYNRPYRLHSLTFIERAAPLDFRSRYTGFRCVYPWRKAMGKERKRWTQLPWGGTSEAVLIKDGEYFVGINDASYTPRLLSHFEDIEPRSLQTLLTIQPPNQNEQVQFSIYEISRRQYRSFLRDPFARLGFYANENEPRVHSYRPNKWEEQLQQLDLPVVGMDWWSAYAFARWAGGRLPTEEEWLYAYRGKEPNAYPWGPVYRSGLAHVRDGQASYFPHSPLPIKAQRHDNTTSGIIALAGNVAEWTSSVEPYQGGMRMIVKGGNYLLPGEVAAHYAYNAKVPFNHRSDAIGIRVVFDGS